MLLGFRLLFPAIVLVSVHFNSEINKTFKLFLNTQNVLYLPLLGGFLASIENVDIRLMFRISRNLFLIFPPLMTYFPLISFINNFISINFMCIYDSGPWLCLKRKVCIGFSSFSQQ